VVAAEGGLAIACARLGVTTPRYVVLPKIDTDFLERAALAPLLFLLSLLSGFEHDQPVAVFPDISISFSHHQHHHHQNKGPAR
jgi:hypothetical protein